MIARFVGQPDVISCMMVKQGEVYNVEHLYETQNGWQLFRIGELDSYNSIGMYYPSWNMFYANWQPMEEVPMKCVDHVCCPRFACPCCKMR